MGLLKNKDHILTNDEKILYPNFLFIYYIIFFIFILIIYMFCIIYWRRRITIYDPTIRWIIRTANSSIILWYLFFYCCVFTWYCKTFLVNIFISSTRFLSNLKSLSRKHWLFFFFLFFIWVFWGSLRTWVKSYFVAILK